MAAALSPSPTTVVVTGATGRVGSRVVRRLLDAADDDGTRARLGGPVRVVALVRDAAKARNILGGYGADDEEGRSQPPLTVIEANFDEPSSLASAFASALDGDGGSGRGRLGLFLACGNVPDQAEIELNVARAASAAGRESPYFCVKLSTARPLVEGSIGPGAVHRRIEEELRTMEGGALSERHAVLRPGLFLQMLDPSEGGALLGVDLRGADACCRHPLADSRMSAIDADDVAACATAILLADDPIEDHGGKAYELTGPEAITLSGEFADAVSSPRPVPVSIEPCSLEERVVAAGMPAAASEQLCPFLNTLGSYETVSESVKQLTGRPATSVSKFVFENPRPFLPQTFRRAVATGKAPSFREAASVIPASLDAEIDALGDDEVLVRVKAAGVNGGADTFGVTRASDDAKNFPLGNEGAGVVVMCGRDVTRFQPGDTAVFVASGGYGEYVRAKEARCASPPLGSNASPAELTALRISALTALVALQRTCPIKTGDIVLVTACCGGTGHFAVQIAKAAGATVIGTVGSTSKVRCANDLGVDRVIDTSKEDIGEVLKTEYPQGIDVAYEGVGGKLLSATYDNLADGGRILIVGSISQYPHNKVEDLESHSIEGLGDVMEVFRSGQTVQLDRGRKIIGNVWGDLFGSSEMALYRDRVFELHAKGELRVLIDPENVFHGVDSVCDAVDYMLSRRSVGKVCVTISD